MPKFWPALVAGFFIAGAAHAAEPTNGKSAPAKVIAYPTDKASERGWWWYERPAEPEEPEAQEAPPKPAPPKPAPEAKKEEKCATPRTWTPDCGFVDPKENFEFQAMQRDALLKQMVTKDNDPQAVEAFQRYIKWVMGRASQVANLWQYNMVQNPDLDPSVTEPISSFGLQLASKVKDVNDKSMMSVIAEEGELVYFSRQDCTYCHQMAPLVQELARESKMRISVVSFDKECLTGFAECVTGDIATQTGAILQVGVVPALFLRIKPQTWIRVATGVVDQKTMHDRIIQFFTAYRHALLKGVNNGNNMRASQDGSYTWSPGGNGDGVQLPSQSDVQKMLQAPAGQ